MDPETCTSGDEPWALDANHTALNQGSGRYDQLMPYIEILVKSQINRVAPLRCP